MYLIGFLSSYFLVRRQVRELHANAADNSKGTIEEDYKQVEGMFFFLVMGVVLGGRLGYVIFYNLSWYLQHPTDIIATWHGGMSFHGGAAGAIIAGWLYCRKNGLDFLFWADRFVITAPVGLGFGRLGNFINGELYGRPTDVPWGMVFPDGGFIPRHPSQLYEAMLEGVLLFVILWPLRQRETAPGTLTGIFFMLYAMCRITVEFFREPDRQLGFILAGWLTMGQLLSLGFFIGGAGVLLYALKKKKKTSIRHA
jgi:phosphatidylglycerol:prolipoprotein diacylglycerol transferase